jgi:sulfopyruvate decarboxylase subunit alpha
MGRLTVPLLEAMGIPHLSPSPPEAEEAVAGAWKKAESGRCPVAVLLDIDFWRAI